MIDVPVDYETEYRRSEDRAHCDALSRLPNKDSTDVGSKSVVYLVRAIDRE